VKIGSEKIGMEARKRRSGIEGSGSEEEKIPPYPRGTKE
jgi:hypothetical protein